MKVFFLQSHTFIGHNIIGEEKRARKRGVVAECKHVEQKKEQSNSGQQQRKKKW